MIVQHTSFDQQAGSRPLRWVGVLLMGWLLTSGLGIARADDKAPPKVDGQKPAEVFYRGKRVSNRFGTKPQEPDDLSVGEFDIPEDPEGSAPKLGLPQSQPAASPRLENAPAVETPKSLAETLDPVNPADHDAPQPLRNIDTQDAEPLVAPTTQPVAPTQIILPPPYWYFPPQPYGEPKVDTKDDSEARKGRFDPNVEPTNAVVDQMFEARIARRVPLNNESSTEESLTTATRWAAPITVAFVVAALTTICTMLVISLVITRRFRESVFRVELSNASMLSYAAPAPGAEQTQDDQDEVDDRIDPLQPRGVATELFDLPLEALVEKTYHAQQQEEAEREAEITESMMQCLFEDNLKLREGIRED